MGPSGNLRTFANLAGRGRVFVAAVAITVKPATPGHTHTNGHTRCRHPWLSWVSCRKCTDIISDSKDLLSGFCISCYIIESKLKQTLPKVSQMHTTTRNSAHATTE